MGNQIDTFNSDIEAIHNSLIADHVAGLNAVHESSRLGMKIAAGAMAGTLLLAACASDDDKNLAPQPSVTTEVAESTTTARATTTTEAEDEAEATTTTEASEEDAEEVTVDVDVDATVEVNTAAVVVTDESLQARTITCGGKYDEGISMLDLSYKVEYAVENPKMMQSLIDISSTDSTYGMGEEGFDFVMSAAYYNPATAESTKDITSGSEETDDFINNVHTAVLQDTYTFGNGDCRNNADEVTMLSTDIPYITLHKGQSVEGMIIPADKLPELLKVMKNQDKFLFLEGSITDADGNEVKTVFITLFANGCDNPIRIEETPETPETTTPPVVTTPPTTTPPTTTVVTTPPTTTPPTTTTPTTTTSTLHPPASGPPPEASQEPHTETATPTPGYVPGNAETVAGTQNGDPTNLDPTEYGTETPNSQTGGQTIGGGEGSVTSTPPAFAPNNPEHVPGSASNGTTEGTKNESQSEAATTPVTGQTAGPGTDPGMPG